MGNTKSKWLLESPLGCLLAFSMTLVSASATAAGPNGVRLDGTLGGSASTLAGPVFNISQGLGKLSGGNLFFSFQYFNISAGQTALFLTASSRIQNVISRVTGPYASTIDGNILLIAASGAPNLFFINPSGVTFTSHASINVPAAFYVTTANYLKFTDGNFYADPGKTSTLSTAAPEAFGFLGTTRAAPVNLTGATLSAGPFRAGETPFQIVAGDVTIDGQGNGAGIASTTGDVRVIATGSQTTEVPLTGPFISNDGTVTLQNGGAIQTKNMGSGNAGDVTVDAGSLTINGETFSGSTGIFSNFGCTSNCSTPSPSGGGSGLISVTSTGETMLLSGGQIAATSSGNRTSGGVTLTAQSLDINGMGAAHATEISTITATNSTGNAGPAAVTVTGATTLSTGAAIESNTQASGNAGDVTLNTGSLNIQFMGLDTYAMEFTGISSEALYGSSGNAGSIDITATGAIAVSQTGLITTATHGTGSAGDVTVSAASLSIAGNGESDFVTGISSGAYNGSGNAGQVSVTTTGLTSLTTGGEINTSAFAQGNAGVVTLNAGSLTIVNGKSSTNTGLFSTSEGGATGNAGDVIVQTGSLTIEGGTSIVQPVLSGIFTSVDLSSLGNAGNVIVNAESLTIGGGTGQVGAEISSSVPILSHGNAGTVNVTTSGPMSIVNGGQIVSTTSALGNAGTVSVTAGSLSIDGESATHPTGLFASAYSGSSGNGGSVTVNVSGAATLTSGGQISSEAQVDSAGQPGSVNLTAGTLSLGNGSKISIENDATVAAPTLITPTTIEIHAGSIQMSGGEITAQSTGNIDASSIDIHYNQSLSLDPSSISSSTTNGNGGAINISGQGPLWLIGSNITTSVYGTTQGNGGDITIDVPSIIFDTGAIQANTSAPQAAGGNVTIDASTLIPSFQSFLRGGALIPFDPDGTGLNVVQAAAPDGVSGTLNVTLPDLNVQNSLARLAGGPATPIALGRDPCRYRPGSSLLLVGRGGLPVPADAPLWADADDSYDEGASRRPSIALRDPPHAVFVACQ